MKNNLFSVVVLFSALTVVSCQNYDRTEESISSGTLKLGVDESYSLMIDSQIDVYQELYKNAHIEPLYLTEAEVWQLLLNDSIQAAITNRPLSDEEVKMFESKKRLPESTKIGTDALALIVSPESKDTVLTMDQLSQIFSGKVTQWNQLFTGSGEKDIKVVFDNNKSCNARYIKEKFLNDGEFPAHFFAVNSNQEVIEYVNTHPGVIGIISVGWISDRDDPNTESFLSKVKMMGIINPANTQNPEMARKPYQAYIYDGSYPLTREVYAIRTGLKGTVGTGFVSFLAGEKGQLIIHKMGMVAASTPARVVRITE